MQCLGQCLIVRGHCFTRHALPRVAPALLAHAWEGGSFPTWGREEEAESELLGIISGGLSICVINFTECQKAGKKERERKTKDFLAFCDSCLSPGASSLVLPCRQEQHHLALASSWGPLVCSCCQELPLPFCRCLTRRARCVRPEALGFAQVEGTGLQQGVQKLWVGAHQQSWVVLWGGKPGAGSIEGPGKLC